MLDETSGHFLRNCLEFGATTNNLRSPMDKLKTQTPWSSWKVSCANMMLTGKIIPQGYIPHLPIQLTKSQDAAIEFTIIVPSMVREQINRDTSPVGWPPPVRETIGRFRLTTYAVFTSLKYGAQIVGRFHGENKSK